MATVNDQSEEPLESLFSPWDGPSPLALAFGTNIGSAASTGDVVDSVIAFANGDISPDCSDHNIKMALVELGIFNSSPPSVSLAAALEEEFFLKSDPKERAEELETHLIETRNDHRKSVEADRQLARDILSDAVKSAQLLLDRLAVPRKRADLRVSMSPVLTTFERGAHNFKPVLSWQLTGPSTPEGWIFFAAFVIAHESDGEVTNIGRCKWKECGRFFRVVTKGRGKPARYFCDPRHRELFHSADSTRRVNEMRERVRKEKETKPRRRRPAKGK